MTRRIISRLTVIGILLFTDAAVAIEWDIQPYVGADYVYVNMPGWNSTFYSPYYNSLFTFSGPDVLPESYPGASLYGGIKFAENFGFEAGADWFKHKEQTTVMLVPTATFTSKVKRDGFHLDIVGFVPLTDTFTLSGFLGIGWIKPRIESTYSVNGRLAQSIPIYSSTNAIARVGFGGSLMITETIGLRARLLVECTEYLHVNTPYGTRYPFDDSVGVTLGIFAAF